MEKNFFISYNRADRSWAEWIAWQIEEAGFNTVLQAWDFGPGSNFALKMHEASAQAKRTVAVLSPDYLGSRFAASEWAEAFAEDPTGELGLLLPVRVRDCDPDGLLGQIVYVDLVGRTPTDAREALLAGVKRGRAKPSTAPGFPDDAGATVPVEPAFPGARAAPDGLWHPGNDPADLTSITPEVAQITENAISSAARPQLGVPGPRARARRQWAALRRLWSKLPTAMKTLTGLLTAIAGLLTALVAAGILPPDPDPTPPPTQVPRTMASISKIRLEESDVTLETVARDRNLPTENVSPGLLTYPGQLFTFEVRVEGYEGRSCTVRWSLYDHAKNARVNAFWPSYQQPGWPDEVLTPDSLADGTVGTLWVPTAYDGSFYVVIELVNDQGTVLDRERSPPFTASFPDRDVSAP